jgi:RNA polymerase sigma factor for flagellar operon FliA
VTGPERDARIRRLFPLVRHIARRVHRVVGAAELDDLIGDGSLGLIRAVDGFDPARGSPLEPYARRLILGAMLNGLRRRDPVSERSRRIVRRADARRFALAQERGTLPSFSELEREDPALRRARIAAYRQAALSLDAPFPAGEPRLLARGAEPDQEALARAQARELHAAIALLPERQRRILSLHYGRELSLHAIGERLRVSPQRVSQLHLCALAELRRTVTAP